MNADNELLPVAVAEFADVLTVAASGNLSLALAGDAALWAWGQNFNGQLGLGDALDRSEPTAVPGLPPVHAIAAGLAHTVVLDADGGVWAWGLNSLGQLGKGDAGNGTTAPSPCSSPCPDSPARPPRIRAPHRWPGTMTCLKDMPIPCGRDSPARPPFVATPHSLPRASLLGTPSALVRIFATRIRPRAGRPPMRGRCRETPGFARSPADSSLWVSSTSCGARRRSLAASAHRTALWMA